VVEPMMRDTTMASATTVEEAHDSPKGLLFENSACKMSSTVH